ncbi:MAG: Beta-galactosidase [Ignavibacteria bacterium]|nr:Beta-galactosidase [Ignavibacteria bacterium]
MIPKISLKTRFRIILSLFILLFFTDFINSQIKIFERTSPDTVSNINLFSDSPYRAKINLNGTWDVSFNNGLSFGKFKVPLAYDYDGIVLFKRKFDVPQELLNNYSFILVCEGINYECEIKINNNFISTHTGGFTPIINPLIDGTLTGSNEIFISVNSEINFKNTVPLSGQINYSKIYGGIDKDIYFVAVPKLFILNTIINYEIDNLLAVNIKNISDVKSSNVYKFIDTTESNQFFIYTKIYRKSDSSESVKSEKIRFEIGDNNTVKTENSLKLNNPVLWSSESPEIYIIETVIENGNEKILDILYTETGFTNHTYSNGQIFKSGKPFKLNGINYYEDQPKFASALDYNTTYNDLRNIKSLGFNAIRVPGRSAHPYVVALCNRLGLYLFQDVPFNELSDYYLGDEKYIRLGINNLAEIIERDRNSPCIFAWGIGNDFDVSSEEGLNYTKAAANLADSLNRRFTYYSSRAYFTDICSETVDFVGINFYERNAETIKKAASEIFKRSRISPNRKNSNLFISNYGICIQNDNTNGFSDIRSQEAQMKFISESYNVISQPAFGNFISSYADWNSENPLNYPLDNNKFLKTSGLFTFNREQKRSAEFVRRILHKEDLQRIQEGNIVQDFPYSFIIIGIITIVIILYFINRDKKFRSGIIRCLYKPTYFFNLVKEQMIVTSGYNILLAFTISLGLSLFFSSILYFYRADNSADMILAKLFPNDTFKITASEIINNKLYMISLLTFFNILFMFFTSFFLYFISFYTKGKSYFKNIISISVWSSLPMLLFLFLGTVLYKVSESNPQFITITCWGFIIFVILYLNRIFLGAKTLFDIRTGKVYLYGFIIIFVIFAIVYSYLFFFTGTIEIIDLVNKLNG